MCHPPAEKGMKASLFLNPLFSSKKRWELKASGFLKWRGSHRAKLRMG